MANIKIELDYPLEDGMSLTFKAPCDCTEVTGLKVYYPEVTDTGSTTTNQTFSFRDAHLNVLTSLSNLFVSGATVKAVVDTTNGYAYIQNADTNGYLETKLSTKADLINGKVPESQAPDVNLSLAESCTAGNDITAGDVVDVADGVATCTKYMDFNNPVSTTLSLDYYTSGIVKIMMDDHSGAVLYARSANAYKLTPFSVSNGVTSIGTPVVISVDPFNGWMTACKLSETRLICAFMRRSGISYYLDFYVYERDSSNAYTLLKSQSTSFSSSSGANLTQLSDDTVVLSYIASSKIYDMVITYDSTATTITLGTANSTVSNVNFISSGSQCYPKYTDKITDSQIAHIFMSSSTGYLTWTNVSISGSTVAAGTSTTLGTYVFTTVPALYQANSNLFFAYGGATVSSSNSYMQVVKIEKSGETLTPYYIGSNQAGNTNTKHPADAMQLGETFFFASSNCADVFIYDGATFTSKTLWTLGAYPLFLADTIDFVALCNAKSTEAIYVPLTNDSTEAIALNSATTGQPVKVAYDGIARIAGLLAGTEITSGGVKGYAPLDGVLSVFPWYGGNTKVETGSYVGTGTYGQSNPNSLTFDFVPKLICIFPSSDPSFGGWVWFQGISIGRTNVSSAGSYGGGFTATITWNGNTVSWYQTSDANYQLNANRSYNYIAIG